MKEYQYRILVFIDILGFSESIKKSDSDNTEVNRIYETLIDLREFFNQSEVGDEFKQMGFDNQVLQISDSLVISKLIQEPGGLFSILQECSFAIHRLITFGFLCRGIIKFGKVYHEKDLIFGPLIIDAFLAEKEMLLPVIKFDKELFKLVKNYPGFANKGNEEWELNLIIKNLGKLNENEYFVDYFTDFNDVIGDENGKEHYDKLRAIITEGLKKSKDSSPYLKYLWAANEFNRTSNQYGNEKINISL